MIVRLFHVTCDDCGGEVVQHNYGTPKGWEILRPRFRVKLKHLCEYCKNKYGVKEFLVDGK